MKNKIVLFIAFFLYLPMLYACPACEKQQPKITRGLTHGIGPASNWDWVIIGVITIVTILTLVYSIKYLVRPGEKNSNHIKYKILN